MSPVRSEQYGFESCDSFMRQVFDDPSIFYDEVRRLQGQRIPDRLLQNFVRFEVCVDNESDRKIFERTFSKFSVYKFRNPYANIGEKHDKICKNLAKSRNDSDQIVVIDQNDLPNLMHYWGIFQENSNDSRCYIGQKKFEGEGFWMTIVNRKGIRGDVDQCVFNGLKVWANLDNFPYEVDDSEKSWRQLYDASVIIYKVSTRKDRENNIYSLNNIEESLIKAGYCKR